ncbi:hypothetical protein CALCODRAFT_482679, partial [Calocera cornea HHB12733]
QQQQQPQQQQTQRPPPQQQQQQQQPQPQRPPSSIALEPFHIYPRTPEARQRRRQLVQAAERQVAEVDAQNTRRSGGRYQSRYDGDARAPHPMPEALMLAWRDLALSDARHLALEWVRRICLPEEAWVEALVIRNRAAARLRQGDTAEETFKRLMAELAQAANTRWGENAKVSKGKGNGVILSYERALRAPTWAKREAVFPRAGFWIDTEGDFEPESGKERKRWIDDLWRSKKDDLKFGHALAYQSVLLFDDQPELVTLPARPESPPPSDDEWRALPIGPQRRPAGGSYNDRGAPSNRDPRRYVDVADADESD